MSLAIVMGMQQAHIAKTNNTYLTVTKRAYLTDGTYNNLTKYPSFSQSGRAIVPGQQAGQDQVSTGRITENCRPGTQAMEPEHESRTEESGTGERILRTGYKGPGTVDHGPLAQCREINVTGVRGSCRFSSSSKCQQLEGQTEKNEDK